MNRTQQRVVLAAAVFVVLASTASDARAQAYYGDVGFSPRLYVGAQVGYNHILNGSMYFANGGEDGVVVPSDDAFVHLTQSGFNWSLYAGLRFSPYIAAEIAWDALYHPSAEEGFYNYAMIDGIRAALRIHFPTGYNVEPFLRIGLGWYFYGDEFEADENGLGYSVGIGANYQLGQALELELLLLYRAWYFAGMELGGDDGDFRCGGGYCPFGDEYIHSVNISVGFHWNSWIFAW